MLICYKSPFCWCCVVGSAHEGYSCKWQVQYLYSMKNIPSAEEKTNQIGLFSWLGKPRISWIPQDSWVCRSKSIQDIVLPLESTPPIILLPTPLVHMGCTHALCCTYVAGMAHLGVIQFGMFPLSGNTQLGPVAASGGGTFASCMSSNMSLVKKDSMDGLCSKFFPKTQQLSGQKIA